MKGILLLNLGTPDAPTRGAVYRYLKEFLMDPRVIDINAVSRTLLVKGIIAPFRSKSSAKGYAQLWTPEGSPIKVYGYRLKALLQEHLGPEYKVALGMRYQSPSTAEALMELRNAAVKSIVVVPLYPQYASASTGSSHEEVMRIVAGWQAIPEMRFINSFYDFAPMIEVFAAHAAKHHPEKFDHVLMSFHGLPQRQLRKADDWNHCLQNKDCCKTIHSKNRFCYSAQCHATAQAIAKAMGIPESKYSICFQSRLGRDPWVQPYTTEMLKERAAAGDKRLLVLCPAFVADCLETTVEVSDEYYHEWKELGGEHLELVESLNDDPQWVKALGQLVTQ